MMMTTFRTRILLLALVTMLAAGCGGTSVGSSSLFKYPTQAPRNFEFPGSPSPQAAAAIGGGTQQPATSQPRQTAAPPPQAATFQISIFGDNAATPGFYPAGANVYQGTIIVFTNKDTQPRSVVSDSGDPSAFNSETIAPGGTWKYTASSVGSFSYHDGTRPYALGSFKVVAR